MAEKVLRVALAGNPNCGKTTLFNALTGATAYVGNWPGVTVEKREGFYKSKHHGKVDVVDLPGIYSLSPYTSEEVISRNFILEEKPDVVINVIDATNLERNLYLTTQLLEIDVPVVVALNMADLLQRNHISIDADVLSKELGVPVVMVSALKKKNLHELMESAIHSVEKPRKGVSVLADSELKTVIEKAVKVYEDAGISNPLFHAINAIQKDSLEHEKEPEAYDAVSKIIQGEDYEAKTADLRYKFITENYIKCRTIAEVAVQAGKDKAPMSSLSDKIDKILTNRWLGIPIFIAIMLIIFHFTFSEDFLFLSGWLSGIGAGPFPFVEIPEDSTTVWAGWNAFNGIFLASEDGTAALMSPGVMLMNLVEAVLGIIMEGIRLGLETAGAWEWFVSLFVDGILAGIQSVLMFLPQILLLFLFFSLLEDSGYMARVAFLLDRIFRKFGLSGRAILPMIMGFGCSIPAVMNTRTLGSKQEKIQTIRVIPYFSCGAKLPILTGIAGGMATLFGLPYVDLIVACMYFLGVIVAIISVLVMHITTQRCKVPPFIMELPAYHRPQFNALMIHLWDKAKHFVKKAFTIILVANALVWVLMHFNWNYQFLADEEINSSILASLGMLIQPLFTPLGFGAQLVNYGWVLPVAAIAGLIAKENATATFTILAIAVTSNPDFADNEEAAIEALLQGVGATPGICIAFIVFNMLTIPCFAAVATAHSELPDKKTFWWTIGFWLAVSYVVGCMAYTVIDYVWTLAIWLPVLAAGLALLILYNRKMRAKEAVEGEKEATL